MKGAAQNYESDLLSTILSEISPQERAQTDQQLVLAALIADAMKRKGLNKNELSRKMNVNPSVITKWLSGTYHIEPDILIKLEHHLGTRLIYTDQNQA